MNKTLKDLKELNQSAKDAYEAANALEMTLDDIESVYKAKLILAGLGDILGENKSLSKDLKGFYRKVSENYKEKAREVKEAREISLKLAEKHLQLAKLIYNNN